MKYVGLLHTYVMLCISFLYILNLQIYKRFYFCIHSNETLLEVKLKLKSGINAKSMKLKSQIIKMNVSGMIHTQLINILFNKFSGRDASSEWCLLFRSECSRLYWYEWLILTSQKLKKFCCRLRVMWCYCCKAAVK